MTDQGGGDATILSLTEVRKSFGALKAVDGVTVDVHRGEVFGIAGPNGAGKTTLFNVITGIPFGPDSGTVFYDCRNITDIPAHKRCRIGLARTFQSDAAFRTLTVQQTIELATRFGSRTERVSAQSRVDALVDTLQLARYRDALAADLPLFVKKLVVIASAMATNPDLLLLDEPAAGLSQREITELADVVRTINGQGVTILLIEHVLPFLLGLSSRVMVMNFGTVLKVGTPEEVISDGDVIAAYLGERGRKMVGKVS